MTPHTHATDHRDAVAHDRDMTAHERERVADARDVTATSRDAAALLHGQCLVGRIPFLVTLGIIIGIYALATLTTYRVGACETRLDRSEGRIEAVQAATADMPWIKAALIRIEAKVDRAAQREPR